MMGHTDSPETLIPYETTTPGKNQKLLYKTTAAKAFNRVCDLDSENPVFRHLAPRNSHPSDTVTI